MDLREPQVRLKLPECDLRRHLERLDADDHAAFDDEVSAVAGAEFNSVADERDGDLAATRSPRFRSS